jgi:hypothetical protein
VFYRVKGNRNTVHTVKREGNWIGHSLCRNWLVIHNIEGKLEGRAEVTGRVGYRCK